MARTKKPRLIGNHTKEQMSAALELIEGGNSIRKAAKLKNISYPTLRRYYLKTKMFGKENTRLIPNYTINQVFNAEQEKSLIQYLKDCAYTYYGLTNTDCRKLAFEMATINKIKMPASWTTNKIAGIEWLRSFRRRHPELTLRVAESCSLARASGFNKPTIEKYFDNLEDVLNRHPNFANGTRVYNLDETATTTVQKHSKVLGPKGIRCLSKVTSAEKGTLCTTCAIVCATGQSIPPIIVFPRKNFKNYMIKGTPPGTLGLAAPSGWMNAEIFPLVMEHFIKHTGSTKENPSLLIYDNHDSHISIEALDLAKLNGVTILTLPPHSSHKTQPLDVALFKPFKSFYNASMDSWMMSHPGQPVTIYDVGTFIGEAYQKALTPISITHAFKKTGIFPFDRTVFTDIDFLPSSVTDRPPSEENRLNETADRLHTDNDISEKENPELEENLPNTEVQQNDVQNENVERFIGPAEFRPSLKAQPKKSNRKPRKKGKSMVATDTPVKEELRKEKEAKMRRLQMKNLAKKKKIIKKILQDSSTESDDNINLESDDLTTDEDTVEDDILTIKDQLGKPTRDAAEGEFVLVEFQGKKNLVYYVAKVLAVEDNGYLVSYLRKKSSQYKFTLPDIPDLASVFKWDVKIILPKRTVHGTYYF